MGTAPLSRLRVEIALYETHKSEWLQRHCDEFVVGKGDDVLGFFLDFHSAYYAGAKKYGFDTDFLSNAPCRKNQCLQSSERG